jgi:predicted ATPase
MTLTWARSGKCIKCGADPVDAEKLFCSNHYAQVHRENQERKDVRRKEWTDRIPQIIRDAGVPERYVDARWATTDLLPPALVSELRKATRENTGLYLHGISGCGKTHAATSAFRTWVQQEVFSAIALDREPHESWKFLVVPEFLAGLRSARYSAAWSQASASNARILVLDELGAEPVTDFTLSILYNVINARYNHPHRCRTIITSNVDLNELAERTNDRIPSRLNEMCRVIRFPRKDLRGIVRERMQKQQTTTKCDDDD